MKPNKGCGAFPRMQHRAIELHDSKVLSVRQAGGEVRVLLDAYVHVSAGEPGRDAGTGWSQEVELVVAGGSVEEAPRGTLWIAEGAIAIDGAVHSLVPAELAATGAVRVELRGAEGKLAIGGRGICVVERGEPVFVEKVPASR